MSGEVTPVAIRTPFIPLDAFLKWSGVADTGGMAKHWIAEGLVQVNGEVCRMRGKKLVPGDEVVFGEERFCVVREEEEA